MSGLVVKESNPFFSEQLIVDLPVVIRHVDRQPCIAPDSILCASYEVGGVEFDDDAGDWID